MIILLCSFLLVVFPPSAASFVEVAPEKSDDPVNKTRISVQWNSATVFDLKIELGRYLIKRNWVETRVSFRPKIVQRVPDALLWNQTAGHYEANASHAIDNSGTVVFRWDNTSNSYLGDNLRLWKYGVPNFSGLLFPSTDYEFEFVNIFEADHIDDGVTIRKIYPDGTIGPLAEDHFNVTKLTDEEEKVYQIIHTLPVLPNAPKSGAGCFYVYHIDENSRTVKVYWKPSLSHQDEIVQCEILVQENIEAGSRIVYQGKVPLSWGALSMNVSLNSHRFNFTAVSKVGRSLNSSVVHVPAQKDLIPALSTNVRKNKDNDTIVLTWEPPANVSVSNYTVSWLDTHDSDIRGASHMRDYVHVAGDKNSFEVKADGQIALGVSVNSENSSSGMTVVHYTF